MTAITLLNQDNVPTGPFTREQVAEKLQTGEFNLESLAFVEGLTQWTPLREVLVHLDAASTAATPPPVTAPAPSQAYSYAATMQPPGHVVYAGFWLRFVAYFLDSLILGIPMTFLSGGIGFVFGFIYGMEHPGERLKFVGDDGSLNVSFVIFEICITAFSMIVTWLYYAVQESSVAQATFGKRILGIKVTDLQAQRIGFGKASGRFFGKLLSGLTLLIGYIMAGFTERKQALHDIIAGTLVVRN